MDAAGSFTMSPSTVPAEQAARPTVIFERKIGGGTITGNGPTDWIDALEAKLAAGESEPEPPGDERDSISHPLAVEIRALLSRQDVGDLETALEPALRARHLLRVGGDPSDPNRWEAVKVVRQVCQFFEDWLQKTGKTFFTASPPEQAVVMQYFGDWGAYIWRMWPCVPHLYLVERCYDHWDPRTLSDYYSAIDCLWEQAAAMLLLQHPGPLMSPALTRELQTLLSSTARKRQVHVNRLLSDVQGGLLEERYIMRPLAARRCPNRSLDAAVRYFLRTAMNVAKDLPDATGIPRSSRRRIRRVHGPLADIDRVREEGLKGQRHWSDEFRRPAEVARELGVSKSTVMNHVSTTARG